jgi:hypothetical protein
LNLFRMNKSILALILIQTFKLSSREWRRESDSNFFKKDECNYMSLETILCAGFLLVALSSYKCIYNITQHIISVRVNIYIYIYIYMYIHIHLYAGDVSIRYLWWLRFIVIWG